MTTSAIPIERDTNPRVRPAHLFLYLVFGIAFGITLTKSEVLSWFRIQEMFRFQSPRMY